VTASFFGGDRADSLLGKAFRRCIHVPPFGFDLQVNCGEGCIRTTTHLVADFLVSKVSGLTTSQLTQLTLRKGVFRTEGLQNKAIFVVGFCLKAKAPPVSLTEGACSKKDFGG